LVVGLGTIVRLVVVEEQDTAGTAITVQWHAAVRECEGNSAGAILASTKGTAFTVRVAATFDFRFVLHCPMEETKSEWKEWWQRKIKFVQETVREMEFRTSVQSLTDSLGLPSLTLPIPMPTPCSPQNGDISLADESLADQRILAAALGRASSRREKWLSLPSCLLID
jgi:hypothetical protein